MSWATTLLLVAALAAAATALSLKASRPLALAEESAPTSLFQSGTRDVSLFCFSVMRTSGYEVDLLRIQLNKGASIFACDDWAVFSSERIWLSPGPPVRIVATLLPAGLDSRTGVVGAQTSSWVNTETFISAWREVIKDGRFKKHDWVVKVDPDAVYFPDRLRKNLRLHKQAQVEKAGRRLKDLKGPNTSNASNASNASNVTEHGYYLRNCEKGPRDLHLFGSLEVLSEKAVATFAEGEVHCKEELDYSGWGEDYFMQKCMDLLGVEHIDDWDVLTDGYCNAHPQPCVGGAAAYHPFKNAISYFECWDQVEKAEHEVMVQMLQ